MARVKQTVMQRGFSFMEVRKDLLERDDLDLRRSALRSALNMRSLATGAIEARPGLVRVRDLPEADDIIEIRPASGLQYGLILNDRSLQIVDDRGFLVFSETSVPWSDAGSIWVQKFRENTVIGGAFGIYMLEYDAGAWSLSEFSFASGPGGEVMQPYWVFNKDTTITPSATSGSVTITASAPIWTDGYIGLRIRYNGREIEVTERVSSTVLRGDVVNNLPPSFDIDVEDASEFRVGEAVIGSDTNYQGVIVGITGATLHVTTKTFFEGPDVGEEISGTSSSSKVTAKTSIAPLESPIWDEPLMSDMRGWPNSASVAAGRLILLDFPSSPDVVAVSSARSVDDFYIGTEDDDGIARRVGDNSPRWLHAVNMGDVLLLADNGVYYIPTRDNGVLSPSTFNTVFVDEVGASEIKPVKVEDGVVFVEAGGSGISAALLDGNVYLKWSVRSITTFHHHLINNPKRLCGPALTSGSAEKYVFVVNGDGTLASVSWQESIREEQIGFAPWVTDGRFVSVSPVFGGYWAVVDRDLPSGSKRFLEKFQDGVYVDCASVSSAPVEETMLEVNGETMQANGEDMIVGQTLMEYLPGATIAMYAGGWDCGDHVVGSDGSIPTAPDVGIEYQVGLNFVAKVMPWPVEVLESPRIGTLKARVMQAIVSVQDTLGYSIRRNSYTATIDPYRIGDDLSIPPAVRTEVRKYSVWGNRNHPEIEIMKTRPGPFRILAIGQRAQA